MPILTLSNFGRAIMVTMVACTPQVDTSETLIDTSYQPAQDGVVYAISGPQLDGLGKGGRITMQTLQGVLNQTEPRVFITIDAGESHDSDWLDVLVRQHGLEVEANQDYLWYLWAFHDQFDGYILFNNLNRESANVAVSLAGVLNAVAIDQLDQDGHKAVDDELGMTQLLDVSEWTESDLIDSKYWELFSEGAVMQEHFSGPEMAPRDYGVFHQLPFFWDDQRDDEKLELTQYYIDNLPMGAPIFGWSYSNYEEYGPENFVSLLSSSDLSVTPTDSANNLSVFAHFSDVAFTPHEPAVEEPQEVGLHTIAFVMSDGEDLGSLMGRATNPHNGFFTPDDSFPVGWTVSPQLYKLASPIYKWLHDNATEDDMFVGAASGSGLLYPSLWSDKKAWAQKTVEDMALVGNRIATVVDYESGFNQENLGLLLEDDQVDAVFFSALQSDNFSTRQVLWSNGKPIIPMRRLGFSDIRTADEIGGWVQQLLAGGLNVGSSGNDGYTLVYANLANTRLSDFQLILDALPGPVADAIQVVRPDTLVQMVTDLVQPQTPTTDKGTE
jgi:hypothetical protein